MIPPPTPPIKDALRGLRFGLKSGRAALRPMHLELPVPLRQIVRQLDRAMDMVTEDIDAISSKLAHKVFDLDGGDSPKSYTLPDLLKHQNGDLLFAQLIYRGLTRAFTILDCDKPLVSELLAVRAFNEVKEASGGINPDPQEFATDLLLAMRNLNVVRQSQFSPDEGAEPILVALNAVFLWFLADRNSDEDEDALLDVCCEVAHALSERIMEIDCGRVETRLFLTQYACRI